MLGINFISWPENGFRIQEHRVGQSHCWAADCFVLGFCLATLDRSRERTFFDVAIWFVARLTQKCGRFVLASDRPVWISIFQMIVYFNWIFPVYTDNGKVRALIRAALNERSMERYILMWLGDANGLSTYFESWALIRDNEASNLLPSIAAGDFPADQNVSRIIWQLQLNKSGKLLFHRPRIHPVCHHRGQFGAECCTCCRDHVTATKWNNHCCADR